MGGWHDEARPKSLPIINEKVILVRVGDILIRIIIIIQKMMESHGKGEYLFIA